MSCYLKLIIIGILWTAPMAEMGLAVRKFVYQKDMSEYCRRRVMPSVFLGRRVVESQSQILHFSQLEVPYSCFISVRTESGSNIILVIQLASDGCLEESCKNNENQVMVFEMGETFGGYWGPLPDAVLQMPEATDNAKYYVMRTTKPITDSTEASTSTPVPTTKSTTTGPPQPATELDYLTIEIPLVNVSGELVASGLRPDKGFLGEETFDFIYDVTPRPGKEYHSNVLPIAQFGVWDRPKEKQQGERKSENEPRFELDYDLNGFTVDRRFSLPRLFGSNAATKKPPKPFKYNVNRRLNFKKNKHSLFVPRSTASYRKMLNNDRSLDNSPRSLHVTPHVTRSTVGEVTNTSSASESWKHVEDLLAILIDKNLKQEHVEDNEMEYKNISHLLQKISNMQHNFSAYLAPNLSIYDKPLRDNVDKDINTQRDYTTFGTKAAPTTNELLIANKRLNAKSIKKFSTTNIVNINIDGIINKNNTSQQGWPATTGSDIRSNHGGVASIGFNFVEETDSKSSDLITNRRPDTNNATQINKSKVNDSIWTTEKSTAASMVDHESWENVVQAAPVMIGILNRTTTPHNSKRTRQLNDSSSSHSVVRKKRFIKAIDIGKAQPHTLTTRQQIPTTSESVYHFSDMQDFAHLVELQDDEIYGRIALRYIGKYVGATLFKICDYPEAKARHVFLFNSSRIVIAINNFTMRRMTLVATPARTLMSNDARCTADHIECQVSGARICIDSMCACDGVPNCGAYDIYDEDSLRCGAFKGLQHNVYLAAFTLLAVLLTLLYTVHYWLKRCVPKVSDAFFIYTDGSENVLYLDSIMRSPNDMDSGSRMVYQSHMFAGDVDSDVDVKKDRGVTNILKKIFPCFFTKLHHTIVQDSIDMTTFESTPNFFEPRRMYSFPEMEISKIMNANTVEVAVQTGDSLEMEFIKNVRNATKPSPKVHAQEILSDPQTTNDSFLPKKEEMPLITSEDSELNILKFFRKNMKSSAQWSTDSARYVMDTKRVSKHDVGTGDETELHTTMYDYQGSSSSPSVDTPIQTYADVNISLPDSSGLARKRLRFDENLTTIPSVEEEDDDAEKSRQNPFQATGKTRTNSEFDEIEEEYEQPQSGARDFMRFWGGTKVHKSRKVKKKTQVSLGSSKAKKGLE